MIAIRLLLVMTILCGLVYPLLVTVIGQTVFPEKANGSLIVRDGAVRGSELIGQARDDPRYFWARLSATPQFAYNAAVSSGTNYGPNNPNLRVAIEARSLALRSADPDNSLSIPVDLLTASGSGLDPHISPEAAAYQASRVARLRGLRLSEVERLVLRHTSHRQFGVLGQPTVNVVLLNLDLDQL